MSVPNGSGRGPVTKEFHVTLAARERYGLDGSLFGIRGDVVVADVPASRRLAARMNAVRAAAEAPGAASIQAGELHALGLIHEVFHHLIERYERDARPGAMAGALEAVEAALGEADSDALLGRFAVEFPGAGGVPSAAELARILDDPARRADLLEELFLTWLSNVNPAAEPMRDLFDDGTLAAETPYPAAIAALATFFESEPGFGPGGESLVALLRAPALASPGSLEGQLRYIAEHWRAILRELLDRLLVALDIMAEEGRALWLRFHGGAGDGRGPGEGPGLAGLELEPERFSMDRDWMPRLVLVAKSTYVWLDQLSRRYGRDIRTLDAIPDEELDVLARWGMSGLWLIGLWERSRASQRIKQMRGNPEAVASAYSLMDYRIADDLGGDAAYANLRDRAWARGIRLASDMVPNHMGIDSEWVMQHPERFLSLPYPPYPAYAYSGADLSWDPRVGIFLEDHYWDSSDAAVTFKRVDRWTGDERYIYHGNDGTSFPWNDTAQLDYSRAEVREAVIRTILHVARQFPVIRFDAAMTLAKRHIQRLWFPAPGSGGGIPSRAEHGMSKAEFDALMPVEFWREVVDRVAAEAPDTLLLAEAFWMLEGYFVRTLGMHRVYNSAFMHMLRDEDNAGYRRVMKDTLEFDPEILKRYVNFMNNPDEKTAVEQFGKGDKYFGIATLMATLPGLPMFGHGQVEGFAEKYGMEYRRAYRDEQPDGWLVGRHERQVFPLLHRRDLFADVRDFLLYDVATPDGGVAEDVFAYSNRAGGERSLVVYHNRFGDARGWIRTSVAYAEKGPDGEKSLRRRTLGEGLGLPADDDAWLVFRDAISGLEYLRNCGELVRDGLYVELDAYRCHVFLGFREVGDGPTRQYRRLAERLSGGGAPSIDDALRELQLEPVHGPLRRTLEPALLRPALDGDEASLAALRVRYLDLLGAVAEATGTAASGMDRERIADDATARIAAIGRVAIRHDWPVPRRGTAVAAAVGRVEVHLANEPSAAQILAARALVGRLGALAGGTPADPSLTARAWFDELRLGPVVAGTFRGSGLDEASAWGAVDLMRVLLTLPRAATIGGGDRGRLGRLVRAWLDDPDVRPFIRVNVWEGVSWFGREAFERLAAWMVVLDAADAAAASAEPAEVGRALAASDALALRLLAAGEAAGYRVDRLEEATAGGRRSTGAAKTTTPAAAPVTRGGRPSRSAPAPGAAKPPRRRGPAHGA